MKKRIVIEEILDSLPGDDPRAVRSRRDLRLINALMGNYRWVAKQVRKWSSVSLWFEIGAGSGDLANHVPSAKVGGVDFLARPERWPESWLWHEGDLFAFFSQKENPEQPEGLLANLFLHHFEEEQLRELGGYLNAHFTHLVVSEPARYGIFRTLSYVFFPFINKVTKHDMIVSIEAGFRRGELPEALGLDENWKIRETVTLLGAYRMTAWKSPEVKIESPS